MATTLDCEVLRDLFGSGAVRRVFDSRALVQGWLDAECALAEAEAEVGVIPESAAATIKLQADASRYDLDALRAGIAESQHPLVPLVRALVERCGEDGKYVHWGRRPRTSSTRALSSRFVARSIRSARTSTARSRPPPSSAGASPMRRWRGERTGSTPSRSRSG